MDFPIRSDKLVCDDAASDSSYELQVSAGMPLRLIISDIDLKTILEEQSHYEPALPKSISLEDELKLLRREHQEKIHPALPNVTISKIISGKPCSLEVYRSLKDKTDLLDEAIFSKNGNAILQVVLHLSKTLKKTLFYRILQQRPSALLHYLNYLKVKLKTAESADLLV